VRASDSFVIGGRACENGYPLFLAEDGRIVPELSWYARKRYVLENATFGTFEDEVYILREWWEYLTGRGVEYWNVTDTLFLQWIRLNERSMEKARVHRKIHIVHKFQRATIKEFKGEEYLVGVFETKMPKYKYPASVQHSKAGRPTPDSEAVEDVLDCLATQSDRYLAARNWLLGKWMCETGLRRQGMSQLTIAALQASLMSEGLQTGSEIQFQNAGVGFQEAVIDRLEEIRFLGRENLFVDVLEKRRKKRTVQVPITLFLETLEFVWSERRMALGQKVHSAVWVSNKTGDFLSAKAIGDIVKKAFHAAEVKGSGHRLRAYYACKLVTRLYKEAREKDGNGWDAPAILLTAAELLGHERIETLRPYLNRAIRESLFT
jgi:site-specific recombinase XerD